MKTREQIIKAAKQVFASEKCVLAAYLFGSMALGTTHPQSDVDFAVLLAEQIVDRFSERARLISALADVLHRDDVDLIALNDADPFLCHRVYRDAVEVHIQDELAAHRFMRQKISMYLDMEGFYRRVYGPR